MTPRLVLLTGPAAGEVAQVFQDDCHCCCPDGNEHRTWDEVRDYWDAPRHIAGDLEEYQGIDYEIRSLPGGEAWLVGLVLPETLIVGVWGKPAYTYVRENAGLPARLAILAPEPPPLLVERVREWGGQAWNCTTGETCTPGVWCYIHSADAEGDDDELLAVEATWPEAVRAALGEVAVG
ncbi:MAG: hypothetical protein ACH37Z_12355 [Anaerolineae bacterium]